MTKQETVKAPAPVAKRGLPTFTEQFIEPLSRLRNEVDRLFEDFPFRVPSLHFGKEGIGFTIPALETTESAKSYKISAELPGMDADDIQVTLTDGLLRIAGEKKEEREETERGYTLSERSYGSFERVVELPAAADADKMKARFKNGVLTVTVPKDQNADQKARRIAIERG